MKVLLLALTLAASAYTQASTLVKTFDGSTAVCRENADIGNRAYRLKIIDESQTASHRKLNLEVQLLVCDSNLKFKNINADTVTGSQYLDVVTGETKLSRSTISDLRLAAYTEAGVMIARPEVIISDGQLLTEVAIAKNNKVSTLLLNLNLREKVANAEGEIVIDEPAVAGSFLLHLN